MKRTIYLDHAATTRPFPEVLEAMLPFYHSYFGNASSAYELGEESKRAMEQARREVAATLDVHPETIYFTSGGTESDNWALRFGADRGAQVRPAQGSGRQGGQAPHLITSSIEHSAVLKTCQELEQEGVRVTYLPVNREGIADLQDLEQAICPQTALISVMYANNEIGTIQPVAQIGQIARKYGILFHCDAVQAYGQIPLSPRRLGIDLLSASAHKFNGPKGIGFLYARKGLGLRPLMTGGAQERGMRAGTENVPGIVGMGKAARISHRAMRQKIQKETALRNYFLGRLLREIPGVTVNGSTQMRLPNNVNICVDGINGAALVSLLDLEGICASAASACSAGSGRVSHVQLAIGNTEEAARSAVRFTLGIETTKEEIDITVDTVRRLTDKLRGR